MHFMQYTIIFDLSDVYIKGIIGVETEISNFTSKKVKNEDLYNEATTQLFNGKISENQYWKLISKRNKWNISIPLLKRLIRKNMTEIEGTRELIEKLKNDKKHKLGLFSVHAKEWAEHCERKYRYHKLFHIVLYSYQIGICKPEIGAFKEALKRMNSKANETYVIDDSEENIITADKMGINTIYFQNAHQLKKDLVNKKLL